MMTLALAALLLSGTQDDPAVLYREGLFEEVDQGNLEKAQDLYGRVLKSSADAALKSRALYRRGACLEKAGKKKEAEQVYRDLQERFPDQAEIVKLARGRLSVVAVGATGPAVSVETEVQQLILDLGSQDATTEPREKAVRRLTLIGEAAVPDLKRALNHKDPFLACGAARVLLNLEQTESLYDVFLRSMQSYPDQLAFGRLLEANPDARERFCREPEKVQAYALQSVLRGASSSIKDPRLRKSIEDRLVASALKESVHGSLSSAWWQSSEPAQLAPLMRRLFKEQEKPQFEKIMTLLESRPDRNKKLDVSPELTALLLEGSKRQDIPDFTNWLRLLRPYIPADQLVKEVVESWLKGENLRDALRAAQVIRNSIDNPPVPGLAEFVFEALASDGIRDEVKRDLANFQFLRDRALEKAEWKTKLLQFWVGYLTRNRNLAQEKEGVREDILAPATDYLIPNLPAEAAGWELLFEQDILLNGPNDSIWVLLDKRIRSSERLRALYVQACVKMLTVESLNGKKRGAKQFESYANPKERLALGKILPGPSPELIPSIVRSMVTGFKGLTVEERTAEIKSIAPHFKSPSLELRRSLISEFRFFYDVSMDGIMKDALSDADAQVRRHALEFWSFRRSPESIAVMIEALKDPDDLMKSMAINALGRSPSLDAVPPILEFLRSTNNEHRSAAQTTLKAIQQYYDEQDQWRKWYEDAKKRAPKDK